MNNQEESRLNDNYINNWRKIKSRYILQQIFEHLNPKIFLNIIKNNKNIKNKLDIDLNDYKKYCEIEIEIIPTAVKFCRNGTFINFNIEEDELYYHIFYNDSEKETKEKNKNHISSQIRKIKVIIDYPVKSFEKLFFQCICIKSINFIKFNRNNINNMSYMFFGCSSLKELNLSNFNTSKVNNMSYMFYGCSSLKELNLSNFKTDNAYFMISMFDNCSSLTGLNLSNFNVSKVKFMTNMFSDCSSLKELDLSNFNNENVKDMTAMFFHCISLVELNLSNSFYSKTKNIGDIFASCPKELILKIRA